MAEENVEGKIARLQLLEQNLQNLLMQKQHFQSQLVEAESALKELETSQESYKIIGTIMVASKKEDLKKDLNEKREIFELRIKAIEKQESQTREKAKKIQTEVMETMEKK